MTHHTCPLCQPTSPETVLWQNTQLRIICVHEEGVALILRVINQRHVAEMTDLNPVERHSLMMAVWAAEQALRQVLNPDKINLASLGNEVPHLHWHVIARFKNDAYFPASIWGRKQRNALFRLPENTIAQLKTTLDNLLLPQINS